MLCHVLQIVIAHSYPTLKQYTIHGDKSLLRETHSSFILTLFNAKEMSELNSAEHASAELIAPDAGAQEHAEEPEATPASWETGSAASLPSIDSQRNNVCFRAGLSCFNTNVGL
jgi:hypothetical protein